MNKAGLVSCHPLSLQVTYTEHGFVASQFHDDKLCSMLESTDSR